MKYLLNLLPLVLILSSLPENGFAKAISSAAKTRKPAGLECVLTKWPFRDQRLTKESTLILRGMDRGKIRSYYLYELTSARSTKDLARELFDFLMSTEPSEEIRSFLEVTAEAADLQTDHPRSLPKSGVCDLATHVDVELPKQ